METTEQRSLLARLIGAARLDGSVYEEVEHDREATGQAALVVVAGAVAAGIAGLGADGVIGLVLGVVFGLAGWAVYAWLTYFIGTRLLAGPETSADWGELARTLAFANGPRILLVIAAAPALYEAVSAIVGIWVLVATIVAVRAALDFGWGRAIATAVIGLIAYAIIFIAAFSIAGAVA